MSLASTVWETVVKLAAHGRRKVGGNAHLVSSSARLTLRDSMVRRLMYNGIEMSSHLPQNQAQGEKPGYIIIHAKIVP